MAFLRLASRWPALSKFGVANPSLHGKSPPLRNGFLPLTTSSAVGKSASAAATTEAFRGGSSQAVGHAPGQRKDVLDSSFDDAHAAYKSKTTWEILRAYIVYTLCSSSYLVENNMKLMKIMKAVMGEKMFTALMKGTFYGHFVAGEDQERIRPTLERLRSFGVKPILDYSVEEDLSQEEAEKREVEAESPMSSVSELGDEKVQGTMPQFHVDKTFADRRYKVSSARTYFYLNEATCERNLEIFQQSLQAVAGATYGTGLAAVKLTALGRPQLLLQLSEVIMRTRQYMAEITAKTAQANRSSPEDKGNIIGKHISPEQLHQKLQQTCKLSEAPVKKFLQNVTFDQEGLIHLFPWSGIIDENLELSETFLVPDIKSGKMVRLLTQLSSKEEEMFRNMIRRINVLAQTAEDLDVRMMVDAEQTYFQPAISRITLEFMRKYNSKKALIFNTYQCYLKDTFNEVVTDLEQAKRQNFYFGAKLVRGAYLEQERARAAALGYNDPTCPSFEATSESYHTTLTECLRRIKDLKSKGKPNMIGIMVASHNEDTVRYAIEKMKEIGISPEDKVLCFGQLLGMCDYITFPLGQSGYSAYKYIPYGPVNEVLPYLSRRAQENKGILKKIKKEKKLLLRELFFRISRGKFLYTPKGDYTPI
ncbi:proline dehydrogenase 1, mitochondrial isoform X23 [Frankliniella occidentalis]|uniref:Proline dehydrogenase n=1 Tax=Frankliniella occidentalis TaxID=133901 RepID=A0A6J1RYN4_FRAOC|nr:proline dehydrogenase 1, mitochondrial isoform X22 [Frankliniella occidentalis]XP_052126523.1 proline dehydrogenase 1, mitochondrial isoform X20 [Frankliniella occidentalis]XP_052126524.1 proline dehydrogenase 1, mitochondrial isoform X21 [Frankliniella occidentalis]XP_052126525.1 proline dehydrogenase 1, mitochondrial isoform X23 [Frankliniella occidentalis]